MKIALATLNGTTVTAHFGRTRGFIVVDVEDGAEVSREFRPVDSNDHDDPGHGRRHADLIGTISDCDAVIAGGMGFPIQQHAEAAGIDVVLTGTRSIDDAVAGYIAGTLDHDPGRAHAHGGDHHHH
jgi:predicted Fe-Mo cluster-binding NifX family protein